MGSRLRWIKYVLAVFFGWAILWPALAGLCRPEAPPLKQMAATPSVSGAVEPLVADRSLGLSFVCPKDGLAGLEFRVATYQRINPARLVLLLYRVEPGQELNLDPAGRVPLRRVVSGAAGLSDWGPAGFRFKPVRDSAGSSFYAVVMSPGTKVFQCVGLVMTEALKSDQWRGYADGEAAPRGPATILLQALESPRGYSAWWWLTALVPLVVLGVAWLRRG